MSIKASTACNVVSVSLDGRVLGITGGVRLGVLKISAPRAAVGSVMQPKCKLNLHALCVHTAFELGGTRAELTAAPWVAAGTAINVASLAVLAKQPFARGINWSHAAHIVKYGTKHHVALRIDIGRDRRLVWPADQADAYKARWFTTHTRACGSPDVINTRLANVLADVRLAVAPPQPVRDDAPAAPEPDTHSSSSLDNEQAVQVVDSLASSTEPHILLPCGMCKTRLPDTALVPCGHTLCTSCVAACRRGRGLTCAAPGCSVHVDDTLRLRLLLKRAADEPPAASRPPKKAKVVEILD